MEETYLTHLGLLEDVARFLAHRHSLQHAEADDLASRVKLKVLENDYEVLRRFQGKSSLRTYLTVVAQRVFLDGRVAEGGKWRASAEAKRLGPVAERLESLLSRDGLDLDQALRVLRTNEGVAEGVEALRSLAQKLPRRTRRRFVGDEAIAAFPAPGGDADGRVAAREDDAAIRQARAALGRVLDALDPEDRLILRMRYADSLQIAEIAAALHLPARPLYKRLERLLTRLKSGLVVEGIEGSSILELLGRPTADFGTGLRGGENRVPRPSLEGDGES
ncbi:MAG TPA: sigma-70 family RNA polymerase sigma factor [Thermoanaerobaculia bacterium]|nr:sigma-70 family RNA polymerase sigma factor [Thermoanaerobaculia bacterium]